MHKQFSLLSCNVDHYHHVQIVCMIGQNLAGTLQVADAHTDSPTVCDVFVGPLHRRQGIARNLVKQAITWADQQQKDLWLIVMPDNEPAVSLYHSQGFEFTGQFNRAGGAMMVRPAWGGRLASPVSKEDIQHAAILRSIVGGEEVLSV